jgi:hypothetical protein
MGPAGYEFRHYRKPWLPLMFWFISVAPFPRSKAQSAGPPPANARGMSRDSEQHSVDRLLFSAKFSTLINDQALNSPGSGNFDFATEF